MNSSSNSNWLIPFLFAAVSLVPHNLRAAEPVICATCTAPKVDWSNLPSTYTHRDNVAVDQFAQGVAPTTYASDLQAVSIYRHRRSSLQGNNSTDHYHRVEQYGAPVIPYGEWRYPYRPFSTPYPGWGPQLPQVYSNFGGNFGRGPGGVPGNFGAGQGNGFIGPNPGFNQGFGGPNPGFLPGPSNALSPFQDELYPEARDPRPMSDRDFFYSPLRP